MFYSMYFSVRHTYEDLRTCKSLEFISYQRKESKKLFSIFPLHNRNAVLTWGGFEQFFEVEDGLKKIIYEAKNYSTDSQVYFYISCQTVGCLSPAS